jgi:NADH-quinone oxidoreductase subunit H
VLAGWASNNKYSMLGGLRASAQMLSYELSMSTAMTIPIIITGSMTLSTIIDAQQTPSILSWFIFQNPLAALILGMALLAEVNRAPFDLPEAEQELTAGYHTEYSGMKFALFFMAEYISMISVSIIFVAFFLGGYHFPFVDQVPILGPVVFGGKVIACLLVMIWIRATLPRIRYDRLMSLGWKVLFPLSLLAAGWTAFSVIIGDATGSPAAYLLASILFSVVVLGGLFLMLRPKAEAQQRGDEIDLRKRGLAYAVMSVVGGLLAIPFGAFNFISGLLGGQKRNA